MGRSSFNVSLAREGLFGRPGEAGERRERKPADERPRDGFHEMKEEATKRRSDEATKGRD